MLHQLEHYTEHNREVMPSYTGDNAPHFEHLEDVGHLATIDVMVETAEYEDAAERAAKEAAEQAELERLGLTDEALYEDWKRMVKEAADRVKADHEHRDALAATAPSGSLQRRNARRVEREHAKRVTKQVSDGNRGTRNAGRPKSRARRTTPRATSTKQLSLIG